MQDPIKALCVDDEQGLLEICKAFLEMSEGIEVDTAMSAKEAWQRMDQHHYDVIVSDYQMPAMDGLQFLKALRSKGKDIPFILFTGRGREEVVIEAFNSGASFYLQKGGDPMAQFAELRNKVKHAVHAYRAEVARRESEEKFRTIFDHANDAILIHGFDGSIIDVNEVFSERFGYTREEILGTSLGKIEEPGSLSKMQEQMKALQEKGHIIFEVVNLAKDGRRIPQEISCRVINYAGKKAVLGIARDITERREAEAALSRSESKYRAIFDGAEVGILAINKESRLVDFNDKLVSYLGYSREELSQMSFLEFTHPDDVERSSNLFNDLKAGRIERYEQEKRYIRKDGQVVWARVLVRMVEPIKGEPVIALAVINDVTDRRRAEEELLDSRRQLLVAMDLAQFVYWKFEPRSRVLSLNDRFYEFYGTDATREGGYDMPIEKYFSRFVHPDDIERVVTESEKNIVNDAPGENVQLEHRIVKRDGQIRHIMVRMCSISDPSGHVTMVRGVNQDITELKLIEEKLQRAHEKLSLLNNITRHDMNNRLVALCGNLMLLRGQVVDEGAKLRIAKMERSVDELGTMLNFAKDYQDTGVKTPRWQKISEFVLDPLQYSTLDALDMSEKARLLEVFADPMLSKVIHNLIDNSVKYSGGPIKVKIDCVERDNDLVLVYEDDGQGIPTAEKEKIFEKGFGKGTGLGLFLSKEILAITGISIREIGEPGKGARFEMIVPKGKFRFA